MAIFETPVSAAIKGTIEGTFGLAGKVVEAAGNAVRGVGEAIGGALEGALSPAPVTVVNNTMVPANSSEIQLYSPTDTKFKLIAFYNKKGI